jgi:pyruvyl transferase EpsO
MLQRTAATVRDALALRRLTRGLALVGSGKVVMTDRLHGHLLALLLGRDNVLLDNSYGKLRSFYETWTHGLDGVYWADAIEHGAATALAVAGAA